MEKKAYPVDTGSYHGYDDTLAIDRLGMSCNAKRAIHVQYERERKAADAEICPLADQLDFRRPGCNYRKKLHPHNSQDGISERYDLARFDEALTKFAKLKAFIHKPLALSAKPWVTDWQGIRLDPYTIDNAYDEDCRKDDVRETFQLSCAHNGVTVRKRQERVAVGSHRRLCSP